MPKDAAIEIAKSVATALGVSAGLPTLGDDVVVWDPNTDVMDAVYRTLRLTQAGLELVAPFLDGLQVLGERHDG